MNPDQQIDLYRHARSVAWSYRLQQYDAAALKDLQRIVEKSKASIVQKFGEGLGQEGSYTRKHYQNTLKELERLSLGLRNQLGEQLTTSTSRIGSRALKEWSESLSVGGVAKKVNTVALSPEQFKAFFKRNPPAGILIPKVMRNALNQGVTARIQGELLDVLREGALTVQSYKRIVDTLEQSFTDFSRTQLTTLTRTFFQTANAQAFDAVYQANQDIMEGKIWTNVNDDRVCLLCLPLGEVLYKKGEEHPPMPRHPNCRCVFRAKTVSYKSLGMDIDELEEVTAPVVTRGYEKNGKWIIPPAGTGTGRRPRAVSFYQGGMKEAFPDMPEAMQKRMLGVSRYNMYKAGDLTIDQMVDPKTGKLFLLKEIEQGEHLKALSKQILYSAKLLSISDKKSDLERLSQYKHSSNGVYTFRAIEKASKKQPTIVIRDSEGLPSAAVNVYKSKGALDIDVLGSISPGAGSEAIKAAAQYSFENGLGGALQATPIRDVKTIEFYEKMGFEDHPTQMGRFYLSPETAKKSGYIK